ncbi:anti-sigma factor [Microbacterium sp. NPDC064584]|uniref:anti-sigma factor n=1 Tax=Microbacterium sp. NPDC064584 TaxID=3155817 RepID=UPI003441F0FD
MNEKDFAELAAGAALHALSPEDRAVFEAAREQHPEWERHVSTDAATAALLADQVVEVAPPPDLRAALLAQIAATAQPEAELAPAGATAVKARRWGARAWFALAASLALLVGVGWGAVFVGDMLATPASVVALNQIESAPDAQSETVALADGGEATAHWSESVGKTVLVTDGLPEISDDQTYELWFVRDGSAIPAGLFASDDGTATALLDGAVESGDVIAVTIEPAGGSPTGQPTSDPILAIQTA